ncbi:MAG: hypothetical protein CM1200mP2_23660 [Planctomycetaceae bacterium]|nr:MAG: hypothetical protein CM1200mP2_23660 [Planctomycetaceae bacterium]
MSSDTPGKNRLPDVTDQVVATYSPIGTINHLGHSPLPHNDAVIEITHDLMEVIYPGYQRRQKLHAGNVAYHVGDLLEGLSNALTQQVARALRHKQALANSDDPQSADANERSRNWRSRKRSRCSSHSRGCENCWPPMSRRPTTAIPPHRDSTKSFSATPGCRRLPSTGWPTNCTGSIFPFIPGNDGRMVAQPTGIDIHPGATMGPSFFIDHGPVW